MACESCNSCEKCDSQCQQCEGVCNASSGCVVCQGFCQINQRVGNFSWGASTAAGSQIFSRDTWNKIITHINNARSRGRIDSGLSNLAMDTNEYMTADKFNEVASALFNLGGNSSSYKQRTVTRGEAIKGDYFVELADQASKMRYKYNQCDNCNTDCNNCNDCVNCNMCLGGNIVPIQCADPEPEGG